MKDHLLFKSPRPPAIIGSGSGFTLIEISIVLVVIGLIVGGVLVGQDLVRAASVRATITQLETFNQAVNTFYGKYGYLPGDIKDPDASNFGFMPRGASAGQGDGNGILQGYDGTVAAPIVQCSGENPMVWVDLSTARLIAGTFNTARPNVNTVSTSVTGPGFDAWFPGAKLGGGNYIQAIGSVPTSGVTGALANAFSITVPQTMTGWGSLCSPVSTVGLTVKQAYDIDKKIDDGLPQTGRILASGASNGTWAYGGSGSGAYPGSSAPASSLTCYDNGGNSSVPMNYSITQSGGNNVNCALDLRFQ